jgi:hypothetical protein
MCVHAVPLAYPDKRFTLDIRPCTARSLWRGNRGLFELFIFFSLFRRRFQSDRDFCVTFHRGNLCS